MAQIFEIVIFTASDVLLVYSLIYSQKDYADIVLNKIDPYNQIFRHRLYRDSCIQVNKTDLLTSRLMVKDLNLLGRDISKTIIVDNSIHAFGYHLANGIPIPSFFGQDWDNELEILGDILIDITDEQQCNDIRIPINSMFQIQNKIFPSSKIQERKSSSNFNFTN